MQKKFWPLFVILLSIFLVMEVRAANITFIPLKVIELSASGLSFVADKGELDNLPEKARGYLVYFGPDQKIFYIGSGKLMEMGTEQSYWYLDQIVEASYLKANNTIYFVNHTDLWEGRAPVLGVHTERFATDQTTIISRIQKDGAEFFPQDHDNFKTELPETHTIETSVVKDYQKSPDQELFGMEDKKGAYRIEPEENGRMGQFRSDTEDLITKSTLEGALEKNNDPVLQEEMQVEIRMSRDLLPDNSLAKVVTDKKKERFLDVEALKKIKRDGAFWSADMSDQQLRRFFVTSGMLQERDRRKYALHHSAGNEISFSITTGIRNNTISSDVRNQTQPLGLILGYEYQLGRTIESLRPFTAQFIWQNVVGSYNDGSVNLHSKESSFGLFFNTYLFRDPSVIGKYVPYLGIGVKRGSAFLSSDEYAADIRYSVDLTPMAKAGIKYRFSAADEYKKYLRIGGGISLEVLYEKMNLGFSDAETFGAPSSLRADNMSVLFGGNIYF